MALGHGPRIVTDGLVLALDAADKNSYPGSGTTWTDLSGNGNNGTLINGVGYDSANGGSLVFDGVNDYVTTNYISPSIFTWSAWFKTNIISSGYKNIISIDEFPSYMLMLYQENSMGFWASDTLTNGSSLNTPNISQNIWYNVVFVREGNSTTNGYKAYFNSSFTGSANTGTWSSSNSITFGGRTTNQSHSGNIAQVSIYNRALTAQEIQQNFNATRSRYGI